MRLIRYLLSNNNPNSKKLEDGLKLSDLDLENECEILLLAVRDEFREKGIGQMLFDKIIEQCLVNNVGPVWLEVKKTNFIALNFYLTNGFAVIGERKDYYRDPVENDLVMKLSLLGQDFTCQENVI